MGTPGSRVCWELPAPIPDMTHTCDPCGFCRPVLLPRCAWQFCTMHGQDEHHMGSVHLGEAKKGALVFPLVCWDLFIPMAGYTKVGILITCLPCITSKRDKPRVPILDCLFSKWWSKQFHTHINTVSKICEILLKKLNDVGLHHMPSWKFHTTGCTHSNINHGHERWVFKSLYRLQKRT